MVKSFPNRDFREDLLTSPVTCLNDQAYNCLIHFYKRCVSNSAPITVAVISSGPRKARQLGRFNYKLIGGGRFLFNKFTMIHMKGGWGRI